MQEDTTNTEAKVNCPTDKEYVNIIQSETATDKQYTAETGVPAKIVYYCRECKKMVAPKRIGKKLSFKCSECDREGITFGTETSIRNFYNIK